MENLFLPEFGRDPVARGSSFEWGKAILAVIAIKNELT